VGVRDDQPHAGEATLYETAQEAAPERFGLGLADVERDHLSVAGLVDTVGEHERLAHDTTGIADLLHLGVEPEVRVAALQRASTEGIHLLVETSADP
jgi:hypothetical protein